MTKVSKGTEYTQNRQMPNKRGSTSFEIGLSTLGLLGTLMDEQITKDNKDKDSLKVLVLHSLDESEKAEELVEVLNEGRKIRAVADFQLSVFKLMSFFSYISAAIEWADMVVVLVTPSYIKDVENIECSILGSNSRIHTRHGFKILEHKIYSDENFPAVAVVYEGMPHNCHEFSQMKCIHWKSNFSEVVEPILKLREQLDSVEHLSS